MAGRMNEGYGVSQGRSTGKTGGPIGSNPTGGSKPVQYISLSQFFMNQDEAAEKGDDGDQVMGYREKPEKAPKVPKEKILARKPKAEGMTGTANIATTAVPIGRGNDITSILDFAPGHPHHRAKKKKAKKKSMSSNLSALLKRHNPIT